MFDELEIYPDEHEVGLDEHIQRIRQQMYDYTMIKQGLLSGEGEHITATDISNEQMYDYLQGQLKEFIDRKVMINLFKPIQYIVPEDTEIVQVNYVRRFNKLRLKNKRAGTKKYKVVKVTISHIVCKDDFMGSVRWFGSTGAPLLINPPGIVAISCT